MTTVSRPIIFTGQMIKALLEGRKTQTRRLVTTEWNHGFKASEFFPYVRRPFKRTDGDGDFVTVSEPYTKRHSEPVWFYSWGNARWLRSPYGKAGDFLWVRETCRAHELTDEEARTDRYGIMERDGLELPPYGLDGVIFAADDYFQPIENSQEASYRWGELHQYRGKRGATVPPIHMPRWASRLTLRVTDVRIEQLQDISEGDAQAEGVRRNEWQYENGEGPETYRAAYECLWNHINGEGSWDENPWVYVVSFTVACALRKAA